MMKPLFTTTIFFFLAAFAAAETIQGIVFDPEGNPVAGAILEDEIIGGDKAVSSEDGSFTLNSARIIYSDIAIFARTDDYSQVGYGRSVKKDESIEIKLAPAASLKARLIHPQTGKPLADVGVLCAGPVGINERIVRFPYADDLKTDHDGIFSAKGLIPGEKYLFQSGMSPEDKNLDLDVYVGDFLALEPGEFDAGDIVVVDFRLQTPKQKLEYFFKPFNHEESPAMRFEKALLQSKETQKPVLVLFVHADLNDDGYKLWTRYVTLAILAQKYLTGYEYVPIDATNREHATELAEKLGVKLPDENEFTIIVCDSDGKIITRRDSRNFNAPQFKPGGELKVEFDPVLLLTFLKEFGK